MNKGSVNIKFDIISMGTMFWIPIAISIISFLYLMYISDPLMNLVLAYPYLEFLVVPFSSWWIIYLYYDYYENKGEEVLLSYPISKLQHGVVRVSAFFGLYLLSIFPLFVYIYISSSSVGILPLLLQFVPQVFFFCSLSFLLITLTKSTGVAITLVAFYVATEFLTKGTLIPWYHVFFFNEDQLEMSMLFNKSIVTLLISLLLLHIGGYCIASVRR